MTATSHNTFADTLCKQPSPEGAARGEPIASVREAAAVRSWDDAAVWGKPLYGGRRVEPRLQETLGPVELSSPDRRSAYGQR
jgi:hypothetical protein